MQFNWDTVRRQVKRRSPEWYLLGTDLPYTTAEALRRGKITAMRGTEISTRKNVRRNGKRFCDIYIRELPEGE